MSCITNVTRGIAAVSISALLLAGCTPSGEATMASSSSAPSPTPTTPSPTTPSPTTPSPTPTAPESFPPAAVTDSLEQQEIRAAWIEYWRVSTKFKADPTLTDLTETQLVTIGEEQNVIITSIANLREAGWTALGGLQIKNVKVSNPTTNSRGEMRATISYCIDRSGLKLVETATGNPVVPPTTNPFDETATLLKGLDGKWRVEMIRNEDAATC